MPHVSVVLKPKMPGENLISSLMSKLTNQQEVV
jgi:hypothetical protein